MNLEELKEKYGDERVLVVPERHLKNSHTVEDYIRDIGFYGWYAERYLAENDEELRQIIPYVVMKHDDWYFVTTRKKGDSRLVGRMSLGTGGHINLDDYRKAKESGDYLEDYDVDSATIIECIERELREETTIDDIPKDGIEFVDVFTDDSEPVSRVHACILCILETDENIEIKETEKLDGRWMNEKDITPEVFEKFEGWSKIAYKMLHNGNEPKQVNKIETEVVADGEE